MATTLDNQQPWVPYEPTKDCSQGFCSIYCPQWCYIIFPPPPPFGLPDGDPSSGTAFSPLIIAIIGILASAFLLVSYYTILSKYCRRQLSPPPPGGNPDDDDDPGQSRRHEAGGWHVAPSSNGLDEALINKITIYSYKRGDGMINGTDCSVCLGEFREEESLRLLPKCTHAFHLHCIDTWLKSHSNCPICRANIVSTETPVLLQLPAPPPPPPLEPENHHPPIGEAGRSDEMVVAIEDLERGSEEEGDLGIAFDELKDSSPALCDQLALEQSYDSIEIRDGGGGGGGDQSIRRSFSMDSSHRGRVSIADVLRMSMEDELLVAKDCGLLAVSGSSRRCGGEHSKESSRSRGLHCVTSPVPMKRSFSSGRFCFTGNGRGRNPVLPM